MKKVSDIKKSVFVRRMIQEIQIPKTIPNIKISSHNKDIVNIDFSILKILQSYLRQIIIYID